MKLALVTVSAFLFAASTSLLGQEDSPKKLETAAKITAAIMVKAHVKPKRIDKDFYDQWLKIYLDDLDPEKLYFVSSDIVEFKNLASELSSDFNQGDLKLLGSVAARYKTRAESALNHALKRIDEQFDFTINESMPFQYSDWSATTIERAERWRLKLKYDLLVERSPSNSAARNLDFLKSRYDSIRKQVIAQTDEQALGRYLNSLCRTFDPHSGYFTKSEFRSFYGSKMKAYSIGLRLRILNGRTMINGFAPEFNVDGPMSELIGYELLAIRSKNGEVHNFREIHRSTIDRLIMYGLKNDDSVTLELFDEANCHRISLAWPRREIRY